MWAGYEFRSDLEFWAGEIADAALDLSAPDRDAFFASACAGSDALLHRVRELVCVPWREPEPILDGSCRPGDVVRDCLVLRLVGRGGMGEVYRAIQRPLKRIVALKVITGGAAALAKEAASVALLNHPNIVSVYDADVKGDRPCLVMEFVEGITLREWMARRWAEGHAPPAADIRSIVRQTAAALAAAHRKGLVHCDVKPENILLVKEGSDLRVRVADFGIAKTTDSPAGPVTGTAGYLAPEQFGRNLPDPRSDIFALGVVVVELLTGRHPFAGGSIAQTYYNTLSATPAIPAGTDAGLAAVAAQALEKVPAQRYQTAEDVIAALDDADVRADATLNPLLSELPEALQRWWSRHSAGAFLALVSFAWGVASLTMSIVLGAACVRVVWASSEAPPETLEMLFGYAIEPNAGLWYLAGTSVCLLIGCGFLDAAFHALARSKAVTVPDGSTASALTRVAAANRTVFRVLTPLIVAAATAFVVIPEIGLRREHAFGWVQSDLTGDLVGTTYESLHETGRIGDLPLVAGLCPNCPVRVTAVFNRRDRFVPPSRVGFGAFLAVALGHQAVLTAFLIWIGAKVLFLFWILSTALLGGGRHGVRLLPDFQDQDDFRFGLGRMDNVYYAILALVLAGAVGLSLQAIANIEKGTYFLAGDPAPALFGQAVLLLATLALLAALLLTPACVFVYLTIRAVDEELSRLSTRRRLLDDRLAATRSTDEREGIRHELEAVAQRRLIAKKQTLLPLRRPAFLILLGASVAMLVVLPVIVQRYRSQEASGPNGAHAIAGPVCEISGNPQPRLR